jgi:hypothetical protein
MMHDEKSKFTYKTLVVNPEEKRPLPRIRRRWENNIKMDLICSIRSTERDVDWINLVQGRILCQALQNTVINILVP